MQVQIYRKTGYVSVLLAFLLHAFLCFFLFIIVIYHYKQAGSLPSQITQDQDQTDIFLDDLDTTEELESQEAETQEIKTENQIESEQQAQHIPQAQMPTAYPYQTQNNFDTPLSENSPEQTIDPDNNKILVQNPHALTSALNYATEPVIPITRRRIRKRRKASKINFQQIADYVQKYSQERSSGHVPQALPEDLGDGVYIDPKGVPHRKSDSDKPRDSRYAHVDDDLAKMTFYSYMKGVCQGLKTAFSINREAIHFDQATEERHILEITIISDGTVKKVEIIKSFGKHDFDEYVMRTIKNYQFAPIPKQLKTPHITKRLDATVRARAGMNRFELVIHY